MLRDGGAKVVGLDEAQAQLVLLGGTELQQLFHQTFAASSSPRLSSAGVARRRHGATATVIGAARKTHAGALVRECDIAGE